jgi:chromosome segregation ATPase
MPLHGQQSTETLWTEAFSTLLELQTLNDQLLTELLQSQGYTKTLESRLGLLQKDFQSLNLQLQESGRRLTELTTWQSQLVTDYQNLLNYSESLKIDNEKLADKNKNTWWRAGLVGLGLGLSFLIFIIVCVGN